MEDSLQQVSDALADLERFKEGFGILTGIFIAFGLEMMERWWSNPPAKTRALLTIILAFIGSYLFLYAAGEGITFDAIWDFGWVAIGTTGLTHGLALKNSTVGSVVAGRSRPGRTGGV